MKKIIAVMIFSSWSAVASAQAPDREALARQVDEYVRAVSEAAAAFLNPQASPAERLKVIEPHAIIYDAKQIEGFKGVVLNEREPAEIRAAAVSRIVAQVAEDEQLAKITQEWLVNREAPAVLRLEALKLEANLSFRGTGAIDAYQRLLDDPDPEFRAFAFKKLVAHGDARAQQRLIQGLENPEKAALPAPVAIGILSMATKKEYYPAVFRLLEQTTDEATRIEAIRAVAGYEPAREFLAKLTLDRGQKEDHREAALAALFGGDRENIVNYVAPILSDENAPARLKAIGIQMTTDVRQLSTYRFKNRKADAYDRAVLKVSREARDPALKQVADRYVQSVRPGY